VSTKKIKKSYPQVIHRKLTGYSLSYLLTGGTSLYIIDVIEKEINMKKETTAPKAPRITKKALMSALEAKGVDAKIVKSLERANIETIKFVFGLL
tara:strand:+ start:607 stop:891 length:285 start_codon:yes stop_codon:yes gene_type:complete